MGYSRIKSVEVNNFMVYKHAVINFDELNIINIKGYNSGGKSTMLKAIAVCLMNMYPKAQAKFIRHGEKYFRIIVRFDDGVSILRDKYMTGQSLYEMYKDDKCVFTTKEGGRLTKVDAVPQIIKNYLSLCIVSTGCLNYQVRQDPLWLIETTGSENYNSLNEILKTEELSRANALLNSDKNKLNSDITSTEASLQEVKFALLDIKGFTVELLHNLENRESVCKELAVKYRKLKNLSSIVSELKAVSEIPNVEKVNSIQLEKAEGMLNTVKSIKDVVDIPLIDKIDDNRLTLITKLSNDSKDIKGMDISAPEVEVIDYDGIIHIENIISILRDLSQVSSIEKKLDERKSKVSKKLDSIVAKAKKQGIKFVQCDNCGTYIEVVS